VPGEPPGQLRGLRVAFEHNALRLIDVAATLPGNDGRTLRRAGQIDLEVAGIVADLADRLDRDEGGAS
jgi:hypothetical protein